LAAWGNRADQHPVTYLVAGEARTDFFDDAYGFVADNKAWSHRVFTANDVKIGPADRSRRYSDDSLACLGTRAFHFFDTEFAGTPENVCQHCSHVELLSKCCVKPYRPTVASGGCSRARDLGRRKCPRFLRRPGVSCELPLQRLLFIAVSSLCR